MIKGIFYLSPTPRKCWCVITQREVTKRSAANWRHGSSTPTVGLTEPPNTVKRSRREYHYSLCGSWRNRELPDISSRYLPLSAFRQVMAYRCTRLCFHNHKEEVFNEWVFSCQRTVPFSSKKKNGAKAFCLTPHSPWKTLFFPSTQKTFLIFLWACPYACKWLFLWWWIVLQFHG